MPRILATDLPAHVGDRVEIAGWLQRVRRLGRVAFLVVRDRSGLAQAVVVDVDVLEAVDRLAAETVVRVTGLAAASAQAPAGVEVQDAVVEVLAEPLAAAPVELHVPAPREALPTVLDHAAVALRHPRRRAAFQVAAALVAGFRETLDAQGFTEIHTPKVVASATESGANVFALDWFGTRAYLAQSPQLYKQTMVGVFERVYEVGPVFRAEPHETARHLAEYVSLDAELGFIEDHRDVMRVLRDVVAGMLDAVRGRAAEAAVLAGAHLPEVPPAIPEIDFLAAQRLIERETGEPCGGEPDLAPAHERFLGEWAAREHASDLLFVTGYPMAKRPFYTHPMPAAPAQSNSFDLIFRGLELVTGGQRLHRYDDYVRALAARGDDPEPYGGYLEAFRHGMPAHGGFAIGLERFTARLTGAANIRETTLFPRDRNRLSP